MNVEKDPMMAFVQPKFNMAVDVDQVYCGARSEHLQTEEAEVWEIQKVLGPWHSNRKTVLILLLPFYSMYTSRGFLPVFV